LNCCFWWEDLIYSIRHAVQFEIDMAFRRNLLWEETVSLRLIVCNLSPEVLCRYLNDDFSISTIGIASSIYLVYHVLSCRKLAHYFVLLSCTLALIIEDILFWKFVYFAEIIICLKLHILFMQSAFKHDHCLLLFVFLFFEPQLNGDLSDSLYKDCFLDDYFHWNFNKSIFIYYDFNRHLKNSYVIDDGFLLNYYFNRNFHNLLYVNRSINIYYLLLLNLHCLYLLFNHYNLSGYLDDFWYLFDHLHCCQ